MRRRQWLRGRLDQADKHREALATLAQERASTLQTAAREAAHGLAARAALAWTQLRRGDAARLYRTAFEQRSGSSRASRSIDSTRQETCL